MVARLRACDDGDTMTHPTSASHPAASHPSRPGSPRRAYRDLAAPTQRAWLAPLTPPRGTRPRWRCLRGRSGSEPTRPATVLLRRRAAKRDVEYTLKYRSPDRYAAGAIYDTVQVRERDVADLFVRVNTTLKARHLYARTREQADRLYARLQAGETFEDLAREGFADSVLAARGGSVGYFEFDEMDPAFEDAAFAREHEVAYNRF